MPDPPTTRLSQEHVMSDTYPRNEPADGADAVQQALQAVQFALDRRDNGGDAGAARE
jgi:hypothetical protein